nr:hypothetical protein [Tanacetum cinerariifolium]
YQGVCDAYLALGLIFIDGYGVGLLSNDMFFEVLGYGFLLEEWFLGDPDVSLSQAVLEEAFTKVLGNPSRFAWPRQDYPQFVLQGSDRVAVVVEVVSYCFESGILDVSLIEMVILVAEASVPKTFCFGDVEHLRADMGLPRADVRLFEAGVRSLRAVLDNVSSVFMLCFKRLRSMLQSSLYLASLRR